MEEVVNRTFYADEPYKIEIYDSPDMPENEATFAISNGGVVDAKD